MDPAQCRLTEGMACENVLRTDIIGSVFESSWTAVFRLNSVVLLVLSDGSSCARPTRKEHWESICLHDLAIINEFSS